MLGEVTHQRGELVLSVSALGDLVDAQHEWTERLIEGVSVDEVPGEVTIEVPGDVVYETELGQSNYYHVFGPELAELMVLTGPADEPPKIRIQGIREPDDEFQNETAERANYDRVCLRNRACREQGRRSQDYDYEGLHTVAAVRYYADVLPGDPDARLVGVIPAGSGAEFGTASGAAGRAAADTPRARRRSRPLLAGLLRARRRSGRGRARSATEPSSLSASR